MASGHGGHRAVEDMTLWHPRVWEGQLVALKVRVRLRVRTRVRVRVRVHVRVRLFVVRLSWVDFGHVPS